MATHPTRLAWLWVINDLVHDVTAGLVPGAALALWAVRGPAAAVLDPAALADLTRGWTWFVLLLFAAAAVLLITGGIRVAYWNTTVQEEARVTRGRSALVKHALFIALFVYAAVVGFGAMQTF